MHSFNHVISLQNRGELLSGEFLLIYIFLSVSIHARTLNVDSLYGLFVSGREGVGLLYTPLKTATHPSAVISTEQQSDSQVELSPARKQKMKIYSNCSLGPPDIGNPSITPKKTPRQSTPANPPILPIKGNNNPKQIPLFRAVHTARAIPMSMTLSLLPIAWSRSILTRRRRLSGLLSLLLTLLLLSQHLRI